VKDTWEASRSDFPEKPNRRLLLVFYALILILVVWIGSLLKMVERNCTFFRVWLPVPAAVIASGFDVVKFELVVDTDWVRPPVYLKPGTVGSNQSVDKPSCIILALELEIFPGTCLAKFDHISTGMLSKIDSQAIHDPTAAAR
jgi:hypothetical protein